MNLVMMLSDPRYLLTYRSDLRSSDDLYHSRIMWYVPHGFKSEALKQDVIYPEQVAQFNQDLIFRSPSGDSVPLASLVYGLKDRRGLSDQ